MRTSTKILNCIFIASLVLFAATAKSQNVIDPADPVITYNPSAPPVLPPFGQIAKWVRTKRLSWNTDSYKCYVYKGMCFRLKFPKTYTTAVDGKKYPLFIFFHGRGELGSVYDNEYSLFHGGQTFRDNVDNGTFDGFILVPQSDGGFWGEPQFTYIRELFNYLITNNKVDPFRIVDDGLSSGGAGTWDMTIANPTYFAATVPISMSSTDYQQPAVVNTLKFMPFWIFQGGLDGAPDPYTTDQVRLAFANAGGNFKETLYPDLGHGTWDRAWAEPDFWPFVLRAYCSNPWPLTGRTEFCPSDVINATIGLTPGYSGYEWRKDGVLIPGAGSNSIQATTLGTYDARVLRNGIWSDWSKTPVVIKIKVATVPPPITLNGLMSRVIPAPDGSTTVSLKVPTGYASYVWQKVGNSTTLGTANIYTATTAGDYVSKVTEQFGCSSDFSTPFKVVDANGPNKPDAAIGLTVTTVSKTSLRLDWSDNPAPQFNETNFEIYQASQSTGPYTLITLTAADAHSYTVTGLNSNTSYYYKIRAVNNTGAAPTTNAATGTTDADTQPPTAPTNLAVTGSSRNSVSLSWTASTDDVGVTAYDIYVNGQKEYTSTLPQFTVYNLQFGVSYNFSVKAKDFAKNVSPFSNQVTGQALQAGLNYKYYTFTGTWNTLPDFNTLLPTVTGSMLNVAITPRTQDDNFAFLWEGYINIPVTGTYNFRTNSDDGSKLYLGALNGTTSPYSFSGTATVNNDGLHGTQNVTSANLTLTAGRYPIAITFYEQGGGEAMTVSWKTPQTGTSFVTIPNSAFADQPVVLGTAPADPSSLSAAAISSSRIDLNWVDNSNNETGFEIWRSTNATTGFATVGTSAPNTTTYSDTKVAANTTYYYKIRAIGQYGESQLVSNINTLDANWKFNNNYNDSSGNNNTLTPSNNPPFDAVNKKEGTHSVTFNGTNQSLNVNITAGADYLSNYSQKSVAFWMRSSANTGTRILADLGGSDNGIAVTMDQNRIYAGIASANNRRNIFVAYTSASTVWNHIAVVYSGSTFRLYVNGVLAASDLALPFTSVGTTGSGSRLGTTNGTNAFNTGTAFFSGSLDNFAVFNKALAVSDITKLMNNVPIGQSYATTLPLPAVPAVPASLAAGGISSTKIKITWNDVANETKYELYKSNNDNSNYLLLATLNPNTTSYTDSGLFANSVAYYKIRSVNIGGSSAFSNEDSAITVNTSPVVTPVANQFMLFGTQLNLNVSATDSDPETLTMSVTNLPAFATFTPGANGQGVISFNPGSSDLGTFTNITVNVADQHGGIGSTSFSLNVNNNANPVITTVSPVTLNEKQTGVINFSASDANSTDVLTFTLTGLPDFAAATIGSNSVQLNLTPGYSDAGVYHVLAKVDDGHNGFDTTSFNITVNNVIPNKKTYVNFTNGGTVGAAPWNNTSRLPALNADWPNLKDETGTAGPIGMKIITDWANMGYGDGTNDYGVVTGNNSGVYPDNVTQTAYFTNDNPESVSIYGLDPTGTYNFTMFGSRGSVNDDRTSIYTIGTTSVSLQTANNSQNTVSINNVHPNAGGTVTLTLTKAAAAPFAYINALVIETVYDDHTPPVRPRNIAAQFSNNQIGLTWTAAAYNALSYQVYKSTTRNGSYTLLNPGATNPTQNSYNDAAISANSTYYYYVRAVNSYGSSPSSDTVSVAIPNVAPVLANISNVNISALQTLPVNVSASDSPGDVITLQISGLPAFATFTPGANGTGVINLAPGTTDVGAYTGVTVTATDNFGGSSVKTFNITVNYANAKNVYINFNDGSAAQPAQGSPWNNMNGVPTAGKTLNNLLDESGNNTGFGLSLVEAWDGANNLGPVTGNNSGVFPDNVMQSFYYDGTNGAKHITLKGFSSKYKYNITLYGGRGGVNDPNRVTLYTVGGVTKSLDCASNTTQTAQFTGVAPDANGQIQVTVQKDPIGFYDYLNAMVIQYPFDTAFYAPSNVRAAGIAKDKIKVDWVNNYSGTTGFEVWRSTASTGTFTLLATTNAATTTYTNTGLTAGSSFFYKVRAVAGTRFSAFSDVVGAATVAYTVDINFNDGSSNPAQPGNWNNTNVIFDPGFVLPNLINQLGQGTGMNFGLITPFTGYNVFGKTTGNNSGIYPDNVMAGFFYVNFGDTANMKIDGLNLNSTYNFRFFGSRLSPTGGAVVTSYKVGNQIVILDATDNTTNTVQITGIKPDSTGTIYFTMYTTDNRGYLNEMTIEGVPPATETVTPPFVTGRTNSTNNSNVTDQPPVETSNVAVVVTESEVDNVQQSKLSSYPNPFSNELILKFELQNATENMAVSVADITGKLIMTKQLKNLPQGTSEQRLDMNSSHLKSGVYLIRVDGFKDGKPRVLRVVKM
jgi:hypothetical protein